MYTFESDTDFYDDFRDILSGEKRIVRVGTKTFEKKCYTKIVLRDGEFTSFSTVLSISRILQPLP